MSSKKSLTFLRGKKIYLRPLLSSDLTQRYLTWLNDPEVTKYIDTGLFPTTKKDLEEFYKNIKANKTDIIFAIVDKKHNCHIGNIKLGSINWVHRFADLGIMIGDKRYWGRGYGTEACTLLLKYAFNRLNLNKIVLGCYATHSSAIKAYERAGFKVEGRLKKMLRIEGKYVDKILMGILQNDFNKKWQKGNGRFFE